MMRVGKDAIIRNPRFRNTLGEVTFASNNQINFGDAQLLIKSVSSEGTRLSFDYFMCTQHGRAILAKVEDKEGSFAEWVIETDKTRNTPPAGVYYFNVDAVNEQTREVNMTVQQYRWAEGKITNAEGTKIAFRDGLDATKMTVFDVTSPLTPITIQAYAPILPGPPIASGSFLYITTPIQQVGVKQGVTVLTPNVDFWIERTQSTVICTSTLGGSEIISVPRNAVSFEIVDQDGYTLRKGVDYTQLGPGFITVSQFTPPAQILSAQGLYKLDPTVTIPASHPENVFTIQLGPNEKLGEVIIQAVSGNYNSTQPDPVTGNITLPVLLLPGEWARWEVRILTSTYTVVGKKYELNGFKKTAWDPKAGAPDANTPGPGGYVIDMTTGAPVDPIPGMAMAIGDMVVKGDQCAIVVSPELTETYEIFGSKENLSFVLECKANDYQTASDLTELLKRELLVMRRTNMEADGITIFEATRENQAEQRDASGTAPRYMFSLSVKAAADWKVVIPVVNRMATYEVLESGYTDGYAGKLSLVPRAQTFGAFQFIPAYA